MKIKQCLIAGILLFLSEAVLVAQDYNLGIPFIQSFPKSSYQAGAPNGDIDQEASGIMYFANSEGLLSYDASSWELFPLPNKSVLRSIQLGDNGRIYVGGQNEFGYFEGNERGVLRFHSLKSLIPAQHEDFEDVWELVVRDSLILFRSQNKIYCIDGGRCIVLDDQAYVYLQEEGGEIYAASQEGGLFVFKDKSFIRNGQFPAEKPIRINGLFRLGNDLLISSQRQGLFEWNAQGISPWNSAATSFLKELEVSCMQKISEGSFALGTAFGGVLMLDVKGRLFQWIKKEDGLSANGVLSIYLDKGKNLWLGLEKGINLIQINSPFRRIFPDSPQRGSGYDVEIFRDQIYLSTRSGLYRAPWKPYYRPEKARSFELIPASRGQSWGLDLLDDHLILNHENGIFEVDNGEVKEILTDRGFWKIHELKARPGYYFAGTYSGISFFKDGKAGIEYVFDLDSLLESSRFFAQDDRGNIWMAQPYRGIFRIELAEDLRKSSVHKYGAKEGLPSDLNNHLFEIGDEIIFCGDKGSFLFDYEKERFEPFPKFNDIFGDSTKIRRLQ
ncbi:MAG: hypothetical protein AAF696_07175, partial [Bacteroidota bacterium]